MREMIQKKGLFIPDPGIIIPMLMRDPRQNVAVILFSGKKIKDIIFGSNIVTDEGDKFYAQEACAETPTYAFDRMFLASAGPATPAKTDIRSAFTDISGSEKQKYSGYPKTNDGDSDNTGAGVDVISWLFSYATTDGNWSGITHAYVTYATPPAGAVLLSSIKFAAAWAKDSNTSAKVFVNHTENGV